MISGDVPILRSRGGMTYRVPALEAELRPLLRYGVTFDGELYVHGVPLQEIQSLVATGSDRVQFHIFDVVPDDFPASWDARYSLLEDLKRRTMSFAHVRCVPTYRLKSEFALSTMRDSFVSKGYEGAIIRTLDGVYIEGRSWSLWKDKPYQSAEFPIVEVRAARGIQSGCAVFVCEAETGARFKVVPAWDHELRRAAFLRSSELIGQPLTVMFLGRSNAGIPQCAQGISIRMVEDTPDAV